MKTIHHAQTKNQNMTDNFTIHRQKQDMTDNSPCTDKKQDKGQTIHHEQTKKQDKRQKDFK